MTTLAKLLLIIIIALPLGLVALYEDTQNWRQVAYLRDGGTHRGAVMLRYVKQQHAEQARRERQLGVLARVVLVLLALALALYLYGQLRDPALSRRLRVIGADALLLMLTATWLRGARVGAQRFRRRPPSREDRAVDVLDVSAETLAAALRAAGVIPRDGMIQLASPVRQVTTDGGGWRVAIELPPGCTVGMVRQRDRLERLASALATTPPYLGITDGRTSGSLTLTRYDHLPFSGAAVTHPLVTGEMSDVEPTAVPVGRDIEGRLAHVDLVRGRHGLVVASSGNGKTQHLVGLLLSLATDPSSSAVLLDGKPDGALDPVLPLVDAHVDASMDGYLDLAAELLEREVERVRERQALLRTGKTVGMRLVIVDEFQVFTGNVAAGGMGQDSPHRLIRNSLATLSRLGRSGRTGLVLASQSYDGRVIDDEVLHNVGWRLVGFAPSEVSRDALGEAAGRYALDTSKMLVDAEQTGTAVVISPGIPRYVVARGWYQSGEPLARAVERLRQRRQLGDQLAPPTSDQPTSDQLVGTQAGGANQPATSRANQPASQPAGGASQPTNQRPAGTASQPAGTASDQLVGTQAGTVPALAPPASQLGADQRELLAASLARWRGAGDEWVPTSDLVDLAVRKLRWTPGRGRIVAARNVTEALRRAGIEVTRTVVNGERVAVVARWELLEAARRLA